ncbi:hypothetical protein METP3_01021 [Methanosarcinales archaeon]|nr:hypothetical protein METP3_01021 [Methanosarcinales archaeon]
MLKRREFLRRLATLFLMLFSGCLGESDISGAIEKKNISIKKKIPLKKYAKSEVYVIKSDDRENGIKELLKYFDIKSLSGKRIALKANYNSQDPFPASTHIDTIGTLVDALKEKGASLVLAERSGAGDTRKVLKETGILELANKKGVDIVILNELESSDWIKIKPEGTHWKKGFLFPKVFEDADAIIQTCCLKTHGFSGFTMSLKNSVGMVAAGGQDGYSYMDELHSSSYKGQMIAEINTAYEPEFIIMDGIKGFSKGGPDAGTLIEPGIMIASMDRVALDAVGVAVLRVYGTTSEVSEGNIFEHEQIARAAELGLGVSKSDDIEIIPVNTDAQDICSKIKNEL